MSMLLHRADRSSQSALSVHFAIFALLVSTPFAAVAGPQNPNAAKMEMLDEADSRGMGNVNLIYAGDGFNIYLPDKPYRGNSSDSARVLVIHQVADDEPIVKSRPKPANDRSAIWQYYDDAYVERLLKLVTENSDLKPNLPRGVHLTIEFYHFVRGKHRKYPQNPAYEIAFVCGTGNLRIPEGRYVPPAGIISCTQGVGSYLTVAETLKQDEPVLQSWARVREGWRRKEQAAADKVKRRDEGERRHGFLKAGAVPWSRYRHGKLLENMFRGAFDKIPSSSVKGNADLYYLYKKYVVAYERRCRKYLPKDAVPIRIVTVKRRNGVEVDRKYSGTLLVHPELADAYTHYTNHPAAANLSGVGAVLRGGVGALTNRQASWDLDIDQLFRREKCDGKVVRQLQKNMSRFHGNKSSLQAEAGIL